MKKVLFILVIVTMVVLSCGNNGSSSNKEYSLKGGTVVTTEGDTITIYGGFLYKPCTQKYWCIDEITVSK